MFQLGRCQFCVLMCLPQRLEMYLCDGLHGIYLMWRLKFGITHFWLAYHATWRDHCPRFLLLETRNHLFMEYVLAEEIWHRSMPDVDLKGLLMAGILSCSGRLGTWKANIFHLLFSKLLGEPQLHMGCQELEDSRSWISCWQQCCFTSPCWGMYYVGAGNWYNSWYFSNSLTTLKLSSRSLLTQPKKKKLPWPEIMRLKQNTREEITVNFLALVEFKNMRLLMDCQTRSQSKKKQTAIENPSARHNHDPLIFMF